MISFTKLGLNMNSSTSIMMTTNPIADHASLSNEYKPRATTQARIHDRLAWQMHLEQIHRERYYIAPSEYDTYVPSASLLTTTEARNNDARAWNDHVQRMTTPVSIKTNLKPVKDHVLRLTHARIQEMVILQEAREAKAHPRPPRYVLSSFMPSPHLLSLTKARLHDAESWQVAQTQAQFQYSAKVVMNLPPLSEHLLIPTKCQQGNMDAWLQEKAQKVIAEDIWWSQRRPTPCSDYHHVHAAHLPSKVTEITVAFSYAIRQKYVEEILVQQEERLQTLSMISHKRVSMPKINHESHLLTQTTATIQCSWTTLTTNASTKPAQKSQLYLPSRSTYPKQHLVTSKLHAETFATRQHRYENTKNQQKPRKVIRALTAQVSAQRLLRPTRAVLLQERAAFHGRQEDVREKKWNIHHKKSKNNHNHIYNNIQNTKQRSYDRSSYNLDNAYTTSLNFWNSEPEPLSKYLYTNKSNSNKNRNNNHNNANCTANNKNSLHQKHESFSSTEVKEVVARAVKVALAEVQQHKTKNVAAAANKKKNAQQTAPTTAPNATLTAPKKVVLNKNANSGNNRIETPAKLVLAVPLSANTLVEEGSALSFRDLSHCVSPMSTFDEQDCTADIPTSATADHLNGASTKGLMDGLLSPSMDDYHPSFQTKGLVFEHEYDLSAPTVDQHDDCYFHPIKNTTRLSTETTNLSSNNKKRQSLGLLSPIVSFSNKEKFNEHEYFYNEKDQNHSDDDDDTVVAELVVVMGDNNTEDNLPVNTTTLLTA